MNLGIIKGIQLPACDVDLLTLGRLIAVPFRQNIREGEVLWLYPSQHLPDNLSLDQYYQTQYLTKAESAFAELQTYPIQIKVWARCEYHWRINPQQKYLLEKIAQSTVWKLEALEHIFEKYQVLKLLILRVYHLSNPCVVNVQTESGAFYWPQRDDVMAMNSEIDTPVISEASFYQRKALLVAGEVYPYKYLEALQLQVEEIGSSNLAANQLNDDIKIFLGWSENSPTAKPDRDLAWISAIAALGNRSIELQEKKSNYQAGTDFENITRQSLEFLGFKIENEYKGGAGGLDLFCSKPYPLVGECKAGRLIPSRTAEELIKLGGMHLSRDKFLESTKLVIGPGNPSVDMLKAAQEWKVSIINAMTLQKLVELKAKYPGAVNLVELKPYLEMGRQIDDRIKDYIEKVEREIRLRSQIIQAVKQLCSDSDFPTVVEIKVQYNARFAATDSKLTNESVKDLTIELSSPLTGYLGRIKGDNSQSDRFYFLRDLPLDD
ncbi:MULTISPECIES: DUF1802 family protein [unclassified Microcoleus]|uniref:DUF1802 family protein n=1 Tax=unclassified Microcoleus TaxID=2642155 RepID=UPI002FCE6CC1